MTTEQQLLALAGAKAGQQFFFLDTVRQPCRCLSENLIFRRAGDKHDCTRCQDRRWVPNPDLFAWRRAFRGLGAEIRIESRPYIAGDFVELWFYGRRAAVHFSEGLRDWEAEVTAYYRAVKQVPNVEMEK